MHRKNYDKIMSGRSDNNIRFKEMQSILISAGFEYRIKGDYYIYYRQDIPEIINLQPKGDKAKAYQVKQIRMLFEKYEI